MHDTLSPKQDKFVKHVKLINVGLSYVVLFSYLSLFCSHILSLNIGIFY